MANIEEDFTLPNKAADIIKKWHMSLTDYLGYETHILSQQKQFRKYRLNVYILNHNVLKIQHWAFNKLSQVIEKRNLEFKEQMKRQQQQRIDIFKTKKRTQVSSHSGLGVINVRKAEQNAIISQDTSPLTKQYARQTPSEAYSSPRFSPEVNTQIITNSYQIFDEPPGDSHTSTVKNSASRSLIDPLINKNSKTPVGSMTKQKSYKNVSSKLHTPTKSALGKYGSRFTNDKVASTTNTANVSPINMNKSINQVKSTTKLIQKQSSKDKFQISIVDKKYNADDNTIVISSNKPISASKQSQCKNSIVQYKAESKQVTSVRAQVNYNNNTVTIANQQFQKQKNDQIISSKTKLVQAKHVVDRKTIDKPINSSTTNATNNNSSKQSIPAVNAKSYQQKLQDTYSNKSPKKSTSVNSKTNDIKSPVKHQQQHQQSSGITHQNQNKTVIELSKLQQKQQKASSNQINYSQRHTRQGSINEHQFTPSIKHASPVSQKYDQHFKHLERPKSLVDLKRRAAPLIEVLKLNDFTSSDDTIQSQRERNDESFHKIVYRFKDIVY